MQPRRPQLPVVNTRPPAASNTKEVRAREAEEDRVFIAKAQAGDAEAFRRLVERHQRRAFAVALGLVRDENDARELVQDLGPMPVDGARGNIVSRGVTFPNLLSMFFTRDVKHRLQQDTYIQRARMFGARGKYLKHFELTIPSQLYTDWHLDNCH